MLEDQTMQEEEEKNSPILIEPRSFHNTTDNDASLRASSDSPESLTREDIPFLIPDISVFCEECENHVEVRSLLDHRYFHRCLQVMKYKKNTKPDALEKLIIRRKNLIRQLKAKSDKDNPIDPLLLQRINEAYEFLKSDLEDTFEVYRQIKEDVDITVQGVGLSCSAECAVAVGICSHSNHRWKRVMEDTKVFQDRFGNDVHKCFFGLYDGHHGHFAAELTARELHHILLMEMAKFDPDTVCLCGGDEPQDAENDFDFCEIHSHSVSYQDEEFFHDESTMMLKKIVADYGAKVDKLMKNYKKNRKKVISDNAKETFDEKMKESLIRAHYMMDLLLSWGKEEYSRVRWSGSSSLCCVLHDKESTSQRDGNKDEDNGENDAKGHRENIEREDGSEKENKEKNSSQDLEHLGNIYIANTGNVRGVLVRGNQVYPLTQLHDATNEKEAARIIKEGGKISQSEQEVKVNGILTATRGLGNHGDPLLRKCVIARPHVATVKIDQYAQFLILASHGVWEHFSEEEAATILLQILPSIIMPDIRPATSIYDLLADHGSQFLSKTQTESLQVTDQIKPQSATSRMTRMAQPCSRKSSLCTEDEKLTEVLSRDNEDLESARALQTAQTAEADISDNDSESYGDAYSIKGDEHPRLPTREEIQRDFARAMAERLTQAALLAGARDNITVMVVLLPGFGL